MILSTSSIEYPSSSIVRIVTSPPKVPIRFAMKFGRSFATTTPLPKRSSRKPNIEHETSGLVHSVRINSTRCMYRGGLKKCIPRKCARKSSERPSASCLSGMPLVFEAMTEPGRRCCSTFSYKMRLISRFSTTASIIRSQSFNFGRSSWKFPILISEARSEVKKAAGLAFFAVSRPARAMRLRSASCTLPHGRVSASLASRPLPDGRAADTGGTPETDADGGVSEGPPSRGTMSSSSVGIPAFARCAAICAPIVPAPKTAAFLTGIMTAR